ncbi:hypothetical protein COLO4_21286 [Corchorus olitorius]|uniref:Uncharacterized protein n=1 Tax=Corchorus olitorius TaxID=93759 RepID=A0A1R3IUB0_9ROSI|nr:hypothetical protein COLO4_21286 [Corchorus olitorius]
MAELNYGGRASLIGSDNEAEGSDYQKEGRKNFD